MRYTLALLFLGACSHRCGDSKKAAVDAGSFGPPVAVDASVPVDTSALLSPIKGITALAGDDRFVYAASADKQDAGIHRIPKMGGGLTQRIEKDPVRVVTAKAGSVYYVLVDGTDILLWPGEHGLANDLSGRALTTDGAYIYFAHPDRISRFPLFSRWDQWSRGFEPGVPPPGELTVCGDHVYWFTSSNDASTVFGLDTTKNAPAASVASFSHTFVDTLGCDAEYLYLSLHEDPRMGRSPRPLPLMRARHDNVQASEEMPTGGFGHASAIITEDKALYACFSGSIVRYDKTNFTAKRLFDGNRGLSGHTGFGPSPKTPMMADATHIYWAMDDGLYRVRKE